MQDLPALPRRSQARHVLQPRAVSANTTEPEESWALPIRIGLWTMYAIAVILVMVIVMLNQ